MPDPCAAHLLSLQVPAIAQTRQTKLRLMHQRADGAAAYYVMREAIASNDSPQTLCQLQTIAVATVVHESMQAYRKSEVAQPQQDGSQCMMASQR